MANGCSDAISGSLAEAYRSLTLAVFGTGARDKMQLAEISVSSSINDITEAETKTQRELAALVKRVRELDPKRQRAQVQELLGRTRVLRSSLASMAKKRTGMQANLETLRQSQLNQNMLLSMKHTTDALQTLGLNVRDADSIMLEMEDATGDTQALQSALSSGWTDSDLSPEDLEAELELLLSDDALCPSAVPRRRTPVAQQNLEHGHATDSAPAADSAPADSAPADSASATDSAEEAAKVTHKEPLPEAPEPAQLPV
jgi:hypothetical protein